MVRVDYLCITVPVLGGCAFLRCISPGSRYSVNGPTRVPSRPPLLADQVTVSSPATRESIYSLMSSWAADVNSNFCWLDMRLPAKDQLPLGRASGFWARFQYERFAVRYPSLSWIARSIRLVRASA